MKIITTTDVATPAAEAWAFLSGHFGDLGRYLSLLEDSHSDGPFQPGSSRRCRLQGGKQVHETLTHVDAAAMAFRYRATRGIPGWLREASNHFSVTATGRDTCRIESHATLILPFWLGPVAPVMAFGIRKNMGQVMKEMKYVIETGRPHPDVVSGKRSKGLPIGQEVTPVQIRP